MGFLLSVFFIISLLRAKRNRCQVTAPCNNMRTFETQISINSFRFSQPSIKCSAVFDYFRTVMACSLADQRGWFDRRDQEISFWKYEYVLIDIPDSEETHIVPSDDDLGEKGFEFCISTGLCFIIVKNKGNLVVVFSLILTVSLWLCGQRELTF